MSCRWRETASSVIFTDEKQHRKHCTVLLTLFLYPCKWCRETKNILFFQLRGTPTRDHVVDWQRPDRQPEESRLISSLSLGLEFRVCTWHFFCKILLRGGNTSTLLKEGSEISGRNAMVENNELTYTMNHFGGWYTWTHTHTHSPGLLFKKKKKNVLNEFRVEESYMYTALWAFKVSLSQREIKCHHCCWLYSSSTVAGEANVHQTFDLLHLCAEVVCASQTHKCILTHK